MNKTQKIVFGLIAIALVIVVAVVLQNNTTTNSDGGENIIKIGVILPLTGPAAAIGEQTKKGIDIAVDYQNKHSGINGTRVEVFYEDGGNLAKESITAYNKLSETKGIKIFFTIYTIPSTAIFSILSQKKDMDELFITSHIARTDITTMYSNMYCFAQSTKQEAYALADFFTINGKREQR